MKYIITFFELDSQMRDSMDNFIVKELKVLLENYPSIIFGRENPSKKDIHNLIIKGANNNFFNIDFSCEDVTREKEAMAKSISLKDNNKNAKILSIINIGSGYYRMYSKHEIPDKCVNPEAYDYDQKIIDFMESRGIEVLFTNCIRNFKYSNPDYMLNRAERDSYIDPSWIELGRNKLESELQSHKDEIDPNAFKVLNYLLTSTVCNARVIGEVIFKALYPEYWKEACLYTDFTR